MVEKVLRESVAEPIGPVPDRVGDRRQIHYLYPSEGFGSVYRRVITNEFFSELIGRTKIKKVAEAPLDSYGIVGAGSLIFTQLDCIVTLIGEDQHLLDRAQALMEFNDIEGVNYVPSPIEKVALPTDEFDFTWNFDRLQTLRDPAAALREICRISKAALISVPNVYTYGQLPHYVYHRLTGTTCEYVGPRSWMKRAPIREILQSEGMEIVQEGVLDVPWWPGFPELPNLVRELLGRTPVGVDEQGTPEANPTVYDPEDLSDVTRQVSRAALFEKGGWWPGLVRLLFAHNVYVMGCKPEYRRELGL